MNSEQTIFRKRPLEERRQKYEILRQKNPYKVPIIFEKHPSGTFDIANNNVKFFTDRNVEFSKLLENVRQIWELEEKETLFFSTGNNIVINPNKNIGDLYDKFQSEDGFLYIQVNNIKSLG